MNVEQKICRAKPYYEELTVDVDVLSKRILSTLHEAPTVQHKVQHSRLFGVFRSMRTMAAGAAFVVIGSAVVAMYASPVIASRVEHIFPVLGQDFNPSNVPTPVPGTIHNTSWRPQFNLNIQQSVSDQGITLTITDGYCEENELAFNMVESFSKDARKKPVINDNEIHLNIDHVRELINVDGGDFSSTTDQGYKGFVHFLTHNSPPFTALPEQFTLYVQVQQIGDVKGNWKFAIPMSRAATDAATKVIKPVMTKTWGQMSFTVNQITIAPSQTRFNLQFSQSKNLEEPNIPHFRTLDVYTSSGERLSTTINSVSKPTAQGDKNVFAIVASCSLPSPLPKSLSIVPDENQVSAELTGKFPISFNGGEIKVTNIEFFPDKTLLYVQTQGNEFSSNMELVRLAYNHQFINSTGQTVLDAKTHSVAVKYPVLNRNRIYTVATSGSAPINGLLVQVPLQ